MRATRLPYALAIAFAICDPSVTQGPWAQSLQIRGAVGSESKGIVVGWLRFWFDPIDTVALPTPVHPDSAADRAQVGSGLVPIAFTIAPVANPTRGPLAVSLSLPRADRASVEVIDSAGRRMMSREIAGGRPGVRRLVLESECPVTGGVYWLRLRQRGRIATARVVVIR